MSDINGIIKYAEKKTTKHQKTIVKLIIAKSVGTKEHPKWAEINAVAVGDAALVLSSMIDSGNLPFGKGSPQLSIIEDSEWAFTDSQTIQAEGVHWDGTAEVLSGKPFKTNLPQISVFKVQVTIKDRKSNSAQAPQQAPQQAQPMAAPAQAAAQPQQAPAAPQQAPANAFDDFDDDIPF